MTDLLTTEDLIRTFEVTKVTVHNWRKAGMPHVKLSPKVFRYRLEAIEEWFGADLPELVEVREARLDF